MVILEGALLSFHLIQEIQKGFVIQWPKKNLVVAELKNYLMNDFDKAREKCHQYISRACCNRKPPTPQIMTLVWGNMNAKVKKNNFFFY